MPKLADIIPGKTKRKLKNIKNMQVIKGEVKNNDFVGQTPNLNSSLGVNAADGAETMPTWFGVVDAPAPAPAPTESKLSTFWSKNSTFLTGLGGAILGGVTGSSSAPAPYTPPREEKKGMPVWAWILIAIVVIVIVVLIVKKMKKG